MSDQTKLPPIIEPWRIVAIILAVVTVMMFAHSVTPTQAEAVTDRPASHQAGISRDDRSAHAGGLQPSRVGDVL